MVAKYALKSVNSVKKRVISCLSEVLFDTDVNAKQTRIGVIENKPVFGRALVNLSTQSLCFGGFSETMSSLEEGEILSSMIAIDTTEFHISVLVNEVNRLVGMVYVNR